MFEVLAYVACEWLHSVARALDFLFASLSSDDETDDNIGLPNSVIFSLFSDYFSFQFPASSFIFSRSYHLLRHLADDLNLGKEKICQKVAGQSSTPSSSLSAGTVASLLFSRPLVAIPARLPRASCKTTILRNGKYLPFSLVSLSWKSSSALAPFHLLLTYRSFGDSEKVSTWLFFVCWRLCLLSVETNRLVISTGEIPPTLMH